MLVAEHADRRRAEQQSGSLVRRQPRPASADYAQHMTVSDEEPAAASLAGSLDQRIHAHANVGRALAAWAAVGEEPPVGPSLLDLNRCDSFVLAVVPLG